MQENTIPAFHLLQAGAARRILLICDHASKQLPPELGNLGLSADALDSHIAWDIGAAAVTTALAAQWQCRAVLSGVSRLVVDCNRAPHALGWMPDHTCGIDVPGNGGLSAAARQWRQHHWYDPYHRAITEQLAQLDHPALIAIHSFTPELHGQLRPWQVGILWNQDGRLAVPLMAALAQQPGLVVGDNQPYSGQVLNYSLDHHAEPSQLPHVSIEIRQDLIAHHAGVAEWADRLDRALSPLFVQMGL